MKKRNPMIALTLALTLTGGAALAQSTPVGVWQMYDDDTKQPLSLVRISETAGVQSGKLEKLLDPARKNRRQFPDRRRRAPAVAVTLEQLDGADHVVGRQRLA